MPLHRHVDTYAPSFKLLSKTEPMVWNNECQVVFERIKKYLLNPPILIPLVSRPPLLIYLATHDSSMACVLGQNAEMGKKE